MPDAATSARLPWRSHWPAAVLAVVAGLIAWWAHQRLFPAYSWNRDEPVYLWHVDLLRDGRLTAPDQGHPDVLLPWLSAARDGELFTQYTLGWPLTLLAADLLVGSPAAALPLGAALATLGTYALAVELFASRAVATIAAGLLVLSPLLAVQGGTYLSYLFTLGLGLIAGALLLSGVRRDRWGRMVVAGVLLGWILLTRPYDAVLWGGAFALHLLIVERARWRSILLRLLVVGLAAVPFVAVTLAYNARVTGSALGFPITTADPLDTFGFGTRRLMPGFATTDYTPFEALRATAKNAFLLPWFLAGSYLTLALALVGLWWHRRERAALVLLLVPAAFAIGYLPFWGMYLSSLAARISGPIYFVPVYAPVCILAALVLHRTWSRSRGATLALVGVLALATVPGAITRFEVNREISQQQSPWRRSLSGIDRPALVLVSDSSRHLLYTNPFAVNDPDLEDVLLFATTASPGVLDLIAEHPGRALYLQEATVPPQELGPREDPKALDVLLTPARVVTGDSLTLRASVRTPTGADRVTITVDIGAATHTSTRAASDDDPFEVLLGGDGQELPAQGTIAITVGYGASDDDAREHPVLRYLLRYRTTTTGIEVLVPASAQRYVDLRDHHEWRHALRSDELTVEVSPAASG